MSLDLSLPIDVIYNPGKQKFREQYEKQHRPVLIKGLLNEQPAGEKWSLNWFRGFLGKDQVSLFDNRVETHKWSHTTRPDIQMTFDEYFDIIERDEYTPLRMFAANLFKVYPGLKKDFRCPDIIKNPLGFLGLMFLGGKDTKVRGHFDIDRSSVLLSQVFGRKRVTLVGPEYSSLLYRLPFNMHTMVDLDTPDYEAYPGLKYVKGGEVILEPGDSLFIPPGYWHFITYLNGGMGVAYRKMNRNPLKVLRGIFAVMFEIPFDKSMNYLFGKKWFYHKDRLSISRTDRVIRKLERNSTGREKFA